ncbi:MAG TPA: type IX secretion system membrane protein PorP/SprF [Cyclobacteriaceae bacterium]|nr:type IX secretion system membrane protein PorP/SprF [Cyclobacteriaceae bacterium]
MKKYLHILFWLCALSSFAQDPEFSQYYAAPLYLNPAFSGTASDHRLIANYRNQWPNVSNGFVTYAFSYDYNLDQLNSGLGLMLMTDKAGSANLRSTTINFQYSYKVRLSESWILSSGLNFGVGFRNVDFNKLVFGDQLAFDVDGNVPSDDPILTNLNSTTYFDFGGGLLMYNRTFWLGFSAAHLNRPNRSLLDEEAQIPIKTSFHGGVRIPLYHGPFKKDRVAAIAPSFVYKNQGQFDQLDIGAYFLYEPVIVGLWYRGIPIQQNVNDNVSQDAVVVILGFQLSKIELSYSYDLTVSELGPIAGGAHEIALKYKLDIIGHTKTKKKERFIPCPTFITD